MAAGTYRARSVKGMRDLLPPETAVWARVEATARAVFARYGYGEIRTPIVEETELFVRGVGEATDIVGKEMYTFPDKNGRSLTLRPENTAPVARAFVEHGLREWPQPVQALLHRAAVPLRAAAARALPPVPPDRRRADRRRRDRGPTPRSSCC